MRHGGHSHQSGTAPGWRLGSPSNSCRQRPHTRGAGSGLSRDMAVSARGASIVRSFLRAGGRLRQRPYTRKEKQAKDFRQWITIVGVSDWSFLTNHARALLYLAGDPEARLRDLAVALEVTERTAYGIVADLTEAGYVVKEKDGRRNRYHIQPHLPLREPTSRERTIGEVLELLGAPAVRQRRRARRG